jgi:uncharacterized protein YggE
MTQSSHTTQVALSLILAAAACAGLQAQTPDPCSTAPQTCATTINTRASASRRLPNSVVDIAVGINASDKELAGAQRQLAQRTTTLLAYLRGQHVERLMTNSVNVSPQTHSDKNGPDKIVGYSASSFVSFRTTPAEAPVILGSVLSNGADTINSTSFTATEEEVRTANGQLSAEAVGAAIAQATAIAKAAQMQVVAVRTINVQDQGSFSPRPMNSRAMAVMSAPTTIDTAAGEQEITVSVDVVVAARP